MYRMTTTALLIALLTVADRGGLAQAGLLPPPGGAVVTWTDGAANGEWDDDDNWNQGVPDQGDAVIIDDGHHNVWLNAGNAERMRSLFVAGGIAVYTYGHKLPVGNDDNDAKTTITGQYSSIVASDAPGTTPALDTDYLEINNDAFLRLDGGRVEVDREADVFGTSAIRGNGLLVVRGGGSHALSFGSQSELLVHGGNLRINMTGGGSIGLGGAFIDVTDDNSDLIIDGELANDIADTLEIGAGNRVDFQEDWELTGLLSFVSGGGEIVGGPGLVQGEVNVAGAGVSRIESELDFTPSSEMTVHQFNTLELGRVDAAAGHETTLGHHATLRIDVPNSGGQSILWNGHIDSNSGNLEVNDTGGGAGTAIFVLNGSMDLGGNVFWGPSDIQGSAAFHQNGALSVSGAGGRIYSDARFRAGSNTTIPNGSELEVHSLVFIDNGANFNGAGDLHVASTANVFPGDDATLDVNVRNSGDLRVGGLFDGAGARLFLNDDFEQTSTGTLHIDIAGPSASEYDRVVVDEDATLAGTLDMNSQDTSAYDIGDRMKLVNAAVNGTFETIAGLSVGVVDGLNASLAVYYEDTVAVNFADNTAVYARVTISGDSDGSNSVDVGDLGNLSTSWNSEGTWVNGDYTGDGFIDVADMGVLATNWNATYPAAAAAAGVPEPGTLALLALGAAAGLAARPRAAVS